MMQDYDIEDAFAAIEEELIASMIRNMRRHHVEEIDEDKQWTMWQVMQLESLERYKKANSKKFGSWFSDINGQIEKVIREANKQGYMDQEVEILKAIQAGSQGYKKMPDTMQAEFFKLNERKLETLLHAVEHDMEKAEVAILRRANDQYRKAIFNAQVYANTGAGTYEKAVDMATRDMLSAGLKCVVYANGAMHTLQDYADMALRTASKRAYLQGEGLKRQEWGITTVIVNKRGNPCPKCLPFCGKILIDDVWSGGSKDGISPVTGLKYPLISSAIAAGLYHPRCKDSHTTYFEGISTPPDGKYSRKELDQIAEDYRKEQKAQYAKQQAARFGRLAKYSLDEENKREYEAKHVFWKNKYLMYTHAESVIENIRNYYSEKLGISDLGRKILDTFDLKSIPANMIPMKEWGYCKIKVSGGDLNIVDYNLNKNDARPRGYRVKTAFHEAYHARANGRKTDYGSIPNKHWLDIEETFAESAAHYLAKELGINDLAPSYPERIVNILPRLKQLPEYARCSTIADFGKIAFEERINGVASDWGNLYNKINRIEHDWKKYSIQYIPDISESLDEYIDKMLENMPQYEKYRRNMEADAKRAMQKVSNAGELTSDESVVWSSVVSIAMNRLGVR